MTLAQLRYAITVANSNSMNEAARNLFISQPSLSSAIRELEEKYGIKIRAIVTMSEVIEHLYNKPYKGQIIINDEIKAAIDEYYAHYGAQE